MYSRGYLSSISDIKEATMRKYAKIFSIILLIALVSCSGNTEKTENELTAPFLSIEKTQTGEWQICITPDENAKALTIPGDIKTEDGTPVTVFGGFGANSDIRNLESLTIESGITVLKEGSFENASSLKEVIFEEDPTLETIESNVFAETAISELTIPESVASIGENAFQNTKITNLTIPSSLTGEIKRLFGEGEDNPLENVTVTASGNNAIADGAFSGLSNLSSLTISDGVTSIGSNSFSGTSSLSSVTFGSGLTEIGDGAFSASGNGEIEFHLPSSVENVGENAFDQSDKVFVGYELFSNSLSGNPVYGFEAQVFPEAERDDLGKIITDAIEDMKAAGRDFVLESVTLKDGMTAVASDDGTLEENKIMASLPSSGNNKILIFWTTNNLSYFEEEGNSGYSVALRDGATPSEITINNTYRGNDVTEIDAGGFNRPVNVTIPDGNKITAIGEGAFQDNTAIDHDILSNLDQVSSVGINAFANTSMSEATVPPLLTTIPEGMFDGSSSLSSLKAGSGNQSALEDITEIGKNAFRDTALGGDILAGSGKLTSIGDSAFENAKGSLGDGNGTLHINGTGNFTIGNGAFAATDGYTSLILPEDATSITIGKDAFRGTDLESVTINDKVAEIGTGAYAELDDIAEIIIEDNTLSIDYILKAFGGENWSKGQIISENPISLTLPADSCDSMDERTAIYEAFPNISSIDITSSDDVDQIGLISFEGLSSLTSASIEGNVDVPLADNAFTSINNLVSVTVPAGLLPIENPSGLFNSPILSDIKIISGPDGKENATAIIDGLFKNTENLKNVIFGEGITAIGNTGTSESSGLFPDNSSGITVTLPSSLTTIGNNAFEGDVTVVLLDDAGKITTVGDSAFLNNGNIDNDFFGKLTGLNDIRENAFSGTPLSGDVLLGKNNITSVGPGAFRNTDAGPAITIPSSIENIGEDVFSDCTDITDVVIEKESKLAAEDIARSFGSETGGTESVTTLILPASMLQTQAGIEAIADAFPNVQNIVILPDASHNILPDGVKLSRQGGKAFSSLKNITLAEGIEAIGNEVFSNLPVLGSITLPSTLRRIGASAFRDCHNLKNIYVTDTNGNTDSTLDGTLPGAITSIGDNAFSGCTALGGADSNTSGGIGEGETIRGGLLSNVASTSIGNGAFSGTSIGPLINIPPSVSSLGTGAFDVVEKEGLSVCIPTNLTGNNGGIAPYFRAPEEKTTVLIDNLTITPGANENVTVESLAGDSTSGTADLVLGNITICEGIEEISANAFKNIAARNDTGTVSVILPYTLHSIGKSAFEDVPLLTDPSGLIQKEETGMLSLPAGFGGAAEIGDNAFRNSGLTLDGGTIDRKTGILSAGMLRGLTVIGNGAFSNVAISKDLVIPDSVVHLGNGAFSINTLEKENINVAIPDDLLGKDIKLDTALSVEGKGVLVISDLYITKGMDTGTGLDDGIVSDKQTDMMAVIISGNIHIENANVIGSEQKGLLDGIGVPENAGGLHSIDISFPVLSERDTFYINNMGRPVPYGERSDSTVILTLNGESSISAGEAAIVIGRNAHLENYKPGTNGNPFEDEKGSVSKVVSIGDRAFSRNENITAVTIPASLYAIGKSAFSDCPGLRTIEFEMKSDIGSISIADSAFDGCPLKKITYPDGQSVISENYILSNGDNELLKIIRQENSDKVFHKGPEDNIISDYETTLTEIMSAGIWENIPSFINISEYTSDAIADTVPDTMNLTHQSLVL